MNNYIVSHLKDMNRRKIFDIFLKNKEVFRNELARITGISAPTVIKSIDFMLKQGLIFETGEGSSVIGRKPNMLKLNENRYYAIGVIYEGEVMTIGLTNLIGKNITCIQVKCINNFEQALYTNIEKILSFTNVNRDDILGIGIGIPGTYDRRSKELFAPLIGYGVPKYFADVIERIEKRYNMTVIVDNDTNLQALGEFSVLDLTPNDDLIHISLGTGVGAGVILNGKLRHGGNYKAGEIGYMAFTQPESLVKKSGWVESKMNLAYLEENYGISSDSEILDDENTENAIEYISDYVSLCLNNIAVCYDIGNFTIGGVMMEMFGDKLFEKIVFKSSRISMINLNIRRQSSPLSGVVGGATIIISKNIERILKE